MIETGISVVSEVVALLEIDLGQNQDTLSVIMETVGLLQVNMGPKGDTGPAGSTGAKGDTGADGITGPVGAPGMVTLSSLTAVLAALPTSDPHSVGVLFWNGTFLAKSTGA